MLLVLKVYIRMHVGPFFVPHSSCSGAITLKESGTNARKSRMIEIERASKSVCSGLMCCLRLLSAISMPDGSEGLE